MLYHDRCKSSALVDVTQSFKLLAEISIASDVNSSQTAQIHIYQDSDVIEEIIFRCSSCGPISIKDISGRCRNCGEFKPVTELSIPRDTSGIYCDICIKRFNDEKHTKLLTLLTKPIRIR